MCTTPPIAGNALYKMRWVARSDDGRSVRVRVKWHDVDRTLDAKVAHAVFAVEVRAEPRLEIMKAPRVEITKIVDAMGAAGYGPVTVRLRSLRDFPIAVFCDEASGVWR